MGRIEYEYPIFKVYYSNNSNNSNIRGNPDANVTLHVVIDKISMKHLSKGEDRFYVGYGPKSLVDVGTHHIEKNVTSSRPFKLRHERKNIKSEDVIKQDLKLMPGFKINWNYSGMNVEKVSHYSNDITKIFVRKYSIS